MCIFIFAIENIEYAIITSKRKMMFFFIILFPMYNLIIALYCEVYI